MNCTDVDDVVDLGCRGRSDIAEPVGGDGMSFYIVVSLVLVVVVVVALVSAYRFQCEWGATSVRGFGLGGGKECFGSTDGKSELWTYWING